MERLQRHVALQELSRDHHFALVLARRSRLAAETGDPAAVAAQWAEVRRLLELELAPHFAVEETLLVPALVAIGEAALAERLMAEHTSLRRHLDPTGSDPRPRLLSFGRLLQHHVRFEEQELFEVAQRGLTPAQLEAIARAADFPRPHRDPAH